MYFGTVTYFNQDRGYGFAKSDGPIDGALDNEVYIHARCLARCGIKSVKPGDRIEFNVRAERQKGVEAQDIRIIEAAEAA